MHVLVGEGDQHGADEQRQHDRGEVVDDRAPVGRRDRAAGAPRLLDGVPAAACGRLRSVLLGARRVAASLMRLLARCVGAWPWAPAIIRPSSSRAVSAVTMPTIRPRYITAIRSASATTSSSSVDTITTAVPVSRSSTIRLWMNSIEPTSTPRVGCEAISSFRVADELAGQHDLLLVAAGQRADRRSRSTGCGCRTPRSGLRRCSSIASRSQREAAGERRLVGRGRGPGSRATRERADEAVVRAVLGDVADAGVEALARAVLGDVLAVERDLAGVGLDQPEQRLGQLGLAVALDAGDAEDLAGPHLERDVR